MARPVSLAKPPVRRRSVRTFDYFAAVNILYLEDHTVFAEQVARQFLAQHTVRVVPTVAAARDAFNSRTYDVVLADYDVVDGKGDEFVRDCRAAQPQLPIVAVSSHERGNAALVCAGASAVCSKMNMDRIEQVIRGLKWEYPAPTRDWTAGTRLG